MTKVETQDDDEKTHDDHRSFSRRQINQVGSDDTAAAIVAASRIWPK